MANWDYELKSGKELREAIDNDDKLAVLENLEKCWREIHKAMPDKYDEDDLQEDLADIENQKDNLENYEDYDMTEEDVEDEINYMLDGFYDFCDGYRIWVELF